MSQDARHAAVTAHLRLATLLGATAEGMTVDEIASEMAVSRRTAQRMRAALEEILPMEALADGRQRRYRIRGGMSAATLSPAPSELAELRLAADALAASGKPERAEALAALERKILASMRAATRTRLAPDLEALTQAQVPVAVAGPQSRVAPEVLRTCQHALQAGLVLTFDYAAANGTTQQREVAPRGLLFGPRSYLVGAIHDWGQPALWRLDRMSRVELSNHAAWDDREFDLRAYAARSFGLFQESPQEIVLRFDAQVAEEVGGFIFHPEQEVARLEDGRVEVHFRAGGLLELARHLFTWGGAAEIVSPPDLVRIMRQELEASLARLS